MSKTPLEPTPFNASLAMYLWFLLIPVYLFRRHRETLLMGYESP